MAMKISMFSDFVCPFCYVGFEVIRKLKPEFDLEIEWRGFQIHPEWPAEGMDPERFYQSMGAERRRIAWQNIRTLAEEIDLPIKPPAVLVNSRLALEAAEFASESGLGEAFEERVYRSYFQEDGNIGDLRVIGALASEVGLDSGAIENALNSGRYSLKLKNTAMVASNRDVTGVPTFFIGQLPLVGAQSLDVMRKLISRAIERGAANQDS